MISERPGPQGFCPVCGRLCLYLADGRRLEAHFDMGEARFDRPCPGTEIPRVTDAQTGRQRCAFGCEGTLANAACPKHGVLAFLKDGGS